MQSTRDSIVGMALLGGGPENPYHANNLHDSCMDMETQALKRRREEAGSFVAALQNNEAFVHERFSMASPGSQACQEQ